MQLEEIVEDIKNNIPDEYSEEEKIAFIAAEFSKRVAIDEHYYWGDKDTKQKMIQLAQKNDLGKHDIKRRLIPFTMTEKLRITLQKCGYTVRFVKPGELSKEIRVGEIEILKAPAEEFVDYPLSLLVQNQKKGQEDEPNIDLETQVAQTNLPKRILPRFPKITRLFGNSRVRKNESLNTHKEESEIPASELNIELDLYKLQTRCKPRGIGEIMHHKIPGQVKKLLSNPESTFRKIYGLKDGEMFTDEYIDFIIRKLKEEGKTPFEILEALMMDTRIQEEVKNAGCVEANRFYNMILKKVYSVKFDPKAYSTRGGAIEQEYIIIDDDELIRNEALIDECVLDDGKKKRYSFCIFAEQFGKQLLWIYSKKTKRMIQLTPEEIYKLSSMSSHIKPRSREFSIELRERAKSFMTSAIQLEHITKEDNAESITVKDIFGDEEELEY